MSVKIIDGLVIWLVLTIAAFLWGMIAGAFIFHDWAWPWEWQKPDRVVGAMWMMFAAPIFACLCVCGRRP